MKHIPVYALLIFVFCTFCKQQNNDALSKDDIKIESKGKVAYHAPNRITRTIMQDKSGSIWIAAFDGVYKYDGHSFTNITSKISSARFYSVLEEREGNFWFSTLGSGVYYYDGKSFQNFTMIEGLPGNDVTCIYEDRAGKIWFGTNGGASCYDGKSFRNFTTKDGLTNNTVSAIMEDKTGKLWFGTRNGVCIYDGKSFALLTNKIVASPMSDYRKSFTNVRSIIEDRKGNVWLSGDSGLWRYDGKTFTNFSQEGAGFIMEDKKGNIWTTSESDDGQSWGLLRYDVKSLFTKKNTITETNASSKMIFTIFEDQDGNIWFGSNGAYRYDGNTFEDFNGGKKYAANFRSNR